MKGPKQKWLSTGRLRRTVLMLGVAGATAGAALFTTATSAQAAFGSEPGNLVFNPPSGPASAGTTAGFWSTTDGCPAGFQASAQLEILEGNGSIGSSVSPTIPNPVAAFSGSLAQSVLSSQTLGVPDIPLGQPVEWAVGCFSGPAATGNFELVQSTEVTISADGATYSTGTVNVTATSTTLTASPNPANSGDTVTLTSVTTATGGAHPAGSVTFMNGTTAINTTPIPVDATGTASTTTSFANAGAFNLTAVFTPTDATTFAGSTSPVVQEAINTAGSINAGGSNPIPVSVTVAATGTLTVTVAANTGVTLAVNGLVATGQLPNVTVNDSRNTFPGWSVSGTQQVFQGPGTNTISASQLGWAPGAVGALTGGATTGPTVAPGTVPGLASASVLGSAPAGQGFGTNVFTAALTLDIPSSQAAGTYTGNMTITYLDHN